jgi:HK97 family phage portal protein
MSLRETLTGDPWAADLIRSGTDALSRKVRWPSRGSSLTRRFSVNVDPRVDLAAGRPIGAQLAPWQSTVPQYPTPSIAGFRQSYEKEAVFRACVDILGRNFAQGRGRVVDRDGVEVSEHDLMKALSVPTNTQGARDRNLRLIQSLYTTGNAIWEAVPGTRSRVPVEYWSLDVRRVAIEPGEPNPRAKPWDRLPIKRYLVQGADGTWNPIPKERIVHWRIAAPPPVAGDDSLFGRPPITAGARELSVGSDLMGRLKVDLQNRAIPGAVLSVPSGPKPLDPAQANEMKSMWRRAFGRGREGETAVLSEGTTVQVVGMKWSEMAIGEVSSMPAHRIAMLHGVPPTLLHLQQESGGMPGTGGSRLREAKEFFWTDVILGLHQMIAEQLTTFVLPRFPGSDGMRFDFDSADVPVLQEAKLRRAKAASEIYESGLVSRHVAQRMGGIEVHGDDEFNDNGTQEESDNDASEA